ncbi:MAG TPA: OmpA family protein [Ideonella sp.]|nr:OmpA family protein [Ideonella sp.]
MTNRSWKLLGGALISLCAAFAANVSAQDKETVLKGSQVTESALIDALAIEGPADAASDAKTRGFRPAARTTSPNRPAGTAAGKANLLITFPTNSADLTGETRTTLDTLARALQSDALAGFSFKVEGHADPRGDAERNKALSQSRAESVAAYLVSKHNILPERLAAVGKGSAEPLNTARPDAPENRRVTIVTNRN